MIETVSSLYDRAVARGASLKSGTGAVGDATMTECFPVEGASTL